MGQIALQTLPKETEVEIAPLNDTIDVGGFFLCLIFRTTTKLMQSADLL